MTENPHSDRREGQKKEKPEEVIFIFSDSDDDVDVDDQPTAKRVKRSYSPEVIMSTDLEPIINHFRNSEFYKKGVVNLRKKRLRKIGRDYITPYEEMAAENFFNTSEDPEIVLASKALAEKREDEEKIVEGILDGIKNRTAKYYGDSVETTPDYNDSPLDEVEIGQWINLCNKYSKTELDLSELIEDPDSFQIAERNIREKLMFLTTYTRGDPHYVEKFKQRLNNPRYDYLCISIHIGTTHALEFIREPVKGVHEDSGANHSIVLLIDKAGTHINIFDSSLFYAANEFVFNIPNLLYALLAPMVFSYKKTDKSEPIVTDLASAEKLSAKNRVLAEFIINTLFHANKPSDFFTLPEKDPVKAEREFVKLVGDSKWTFSSYKYTPQYTYQVKAADDFFADGYCGTYSAWFCWLCALNPINVIYTDGVTHPPAQNIKAFAAYIRRCIKAKEITIPEEMQGYKEVQI